MFAKVLYLYAAPLTSKLNHALKEKVIETFITLKQNFKKFSIFENDFDLSLNKTKNQLVTFSQELICWSDLIILQFPLWWYSTPGAFKVWFDAVMKNNFAYKITNGEVNGLLNGKKVVFIITVGANKNSKVCGEVLPEIEKFLEPLIWSWKFIGIQNLENLFFYGCNKVNKTIFSFMCCELNNFLTKLLK